MFSLLQVPLVLGQQTVNAETLSAAGLLGLKVLFVVAGLIYVAFAIVIIRQIRIMQQSLVTTLAGKLRLLGFTHLLLALAALAYFLFIL